MRPANHLKMSELARESGVPASTIKHYLREGVVPDAAVRTSRNMAWYPTEMVEQVRTVKRLQTEQYLPLKVIKELLDHDQIGTVAAVGVARALDQLASRRTRARAEVVADGLGAHELGWLERLGLVSAEGDRYAGDDLALIELLATARREGITPQMVPATALTGYVQALRDLLHFEWATFDQGIAAHAAPDDQARLATLATTLGEQLIVLLRRKLLLQILNERRGAAE